MGIFRGTSTATISKHPSRYPANYPKSWERADGCHLICDGAEYVDWVMGLAGAGILGHDAFLTSICGNLAHMPHVSQERVSEFLCSVLPDYAESVHWCVNGSDATAGAIRLARAITNRRNVALFHGGYHGDSYDWCIPWPARGVIADSAIRLDWNDDRALRRACKRYRLAAVIFEVGAEDPTAEFVAALNEVPTHGTLLVADEVVTGFRLALGGACESYGIKPNLACFGKSMSSGFPISAIVGQWELLREFDPKEANSPVFNSYTHAGNRAGLAAVRTTIQMIVETDAIARVRTIGAQLWHGFESAFGADFAHAVGQYARSGFRFKSDNRSYTALFQSKMAELGHLFGVTNAPSIAHTETVTQDAIEKMCIVAEHMKRAASGSWDVPPKLYQVRT